LLKSARFLIRIIRRIMPANLPPQYYELEREYRREKDPREKLRLAQELLAIMPKHKGTDKLQADLKAKISKLKAQVEGSAKKHGARRGETHDHIDKEGAAQVILIGPPNSGKSTIVDTLTAAKPLIGDYPYTTREPLAGMMTFETIQIQLIDTPPISREALEPFMFSLIRQADLVVLVVDIASAGFDEGVRVIFERLEEKRIILKPRLTKSEDPRFAYKKTIIAAHKYLEENAGKNLEDLRRVYPDFMIVPTSIIDDRAIDNFKRAVFDSLEIMRIYTKRIGHDPDFVDPIIIPLGGTVEDAAIVLHKDFAQRLQYARVWGSGKYEGQRVRNNFVLSDGDIVEFHI
jgi:ribosome-interacting GTPase 1